jgi:putative FmdB family regulatory protein
MPIKEYECVACHNRFEEIVGIHDPDPAACPKCGGKELKRLLSTFRIMGASKKASNDLDGGDDFGADAGLGSEGGLGDDGGFDAGGGLGDSSFEGGAEDFGPESDAGGDDGGPDAGPADTKEEDAS